MFAYSSDTEILPSLTFTKAELVYAAFVLLDDIPITNNSTEIELVEMRHYLNLIRDKVTLSTYDGSLRKAVEDFCKTHEEKAQDKEEEPVDIPSAPSMEELKKQFPNLTEAEIAEVLAAELSDRRRRKAEEDAKKKDEEPTKPSFIAKPIVAPWGNQKDTPETSEKPSTSPYMSKRDRENAEKFVELLGAS